MKTGAILTGVVAIAAAAPAISTGKGPSVPSAAVISSRQQDGDWHIGCEDTGKTHKCFYYKDGGKIEARSKVYQDSSVYSSTYAQNNPSTTHAVYKQSKNHPVYKSTTYHQPESTSVYPEYKSSSKAYDRPKHTSTHLAYKSTPTSKADDLPKSTSINRDYKPTKTFPTYKPTRDLYDLPTPSYIRRGDQDPYEPPNYTPPSPLEYRPTPSKPTSHDPPAYNTLSRLGYKSTKSAYTHPSLSQYKPTASPVSYEIPSPSKPPHGGKSEESHGGKPEVVHGGKTEKSHSGKAIKPTSPPFCNFVESECVDCNDHPGKCDTCNFMFKCGEKKQCTYHGFRETMTLCKEVGKECPWPSWSDDEYEASDKDFDKLHGDDFEKLQGGKPDHPKISHDENEHSENEHVPASPHGPNGPKGGEQPHVPKPAENLVQDPRSSTAYPHSHSPDSRP